jgi:hypothetical protein
LPLFFSVRPRACLPTLEPGDAKLLVTERFYQRKSPASDNACTSSMCCWWTPSRIAATISGRCHS